MADVDKGLYAAPVGIDEAAIEEQAIEIEIEDPESITIGIGDTEIIIDLSSILSPNSSKPST